MANTIFGLQGRVEKGTTTPDAQGVLWLDENTSPATAKIQVNAAGGTPSFVNLGGSGGAGTPNDLLDGSAHQDTTAGTVVRGDIITGQGASPTWKRLAKGTNGDLLQMGANEPGWVAVPTATAHSLLSATHSDTTAATVARGRWVMGKGSSPTWQMMGPRSLVLPYLQNRFILIGLIHGYDQSLTSLLHSFGRATGAVVTGSSVVPSLSGDQYGRFSVTTTSNIIHRTNGHEVTPVMYPYMWSCVRSVDLVDGAMFVGFSSVATPTNATPFANNNSACFWWRNGTHTNWQAVTRDGTTTSSPVDTGVAPDTTNFQLMEVVSNDGGTSYQFFINGSQVASISSNVPTSASVLYSHFGTCINISSSTRTVDFKSCGTAVGDPASTINWFDPEQAGHL